MRDALWITWKDLRLLTRDRRALIILVAMPMVIIAIVGSSTGRLRSGAEAAHKGLFIEVADNNASETSRRLSGFLAGYERVFLRPLAVPDADDPAAWSALRSGRPSHDIDARLCIGPEFETCVRALERTVLTSPDESTRGADGLERLDLSLTFPASSSDPMTEGLTKALVRLALQNAVLPIVAEKIPTFRGAARRAVIPPAWETTPAASAADIDTGNRVYQFFVPSYTVLFVFFLINIMGRSFLGERDTGTLRRLRIAPITPWSILIGKTLPFLILSLIQTTILLVFGRLLLGMSWGPQPLWLVPVVLCTSLAATALGLMFSTIARTESQVSSLGNLVLLVSAGISGCLVPRAWMPPFSQKLSLLTPHAWALDAYSELLTRTAPQTAIVLNSCGMLMVFAAVFFSIGLWKFRSME
jgi:ABC-2 type transport system permease protein